MHLKNNEERVIAKLCIAIFLAFALFPLSFAFTGSANGIETNAGIQTISSEAYNSTGGLNTLSIAGIAPVGPYSGAYGGFFGLLNNVSQNSESLENTINITLLSPLNNSGTNNASVNFVISTSGNDISNCTLIIDGNTAAATYSPAIGNIAFTENLAIGRHNWTAECFDTLNQRSFTTTNSFAVFSTIGFNSETTDLSSVNVSNIIDLTIAKTGYGKIVFDGSTDLSNGTDFNQHIIIGTKSIIVDSAALPQINKSATLTLFNAGITHPILLLDGLNCTDCNILSNDIDLIFSVTHFSNYSADENAQLRVWDSTDQANKFSGSNIIFYANYTDRITGESINEVNANCDVTFPDDGNYIMTFNSSSRLFEYNRTFNTTGVHGFDIRCNDTSGTYTGFLLSDNSIIGNVEGPLSPNNITVISSERANLTTASGAIEVQEGNVSVLMINSMEISKSWQGCYGVVSGKMMLKDSSESTFYDWNFSSPKGQVYAVRVASPDFSGIKCATPAEIANEELFIGQNATDPDSVRNTFNKSTHPEFFVGNVQIQANSCNATNLYVNSESQDTTFFEVLMSDSLSNTIYTGLMNGSSLGFNNQPADFQMIIGDDGHNGDAQVTQYYFFIEIS
jgi:hypothetical protein